ncbi:MAG: 23S rRNA (adenine(2503)-C(2))-methyltransferase @ tRNA (adenine(37)-C(2))-methyltransferase, partial [uncultured Gemmatimonadaceae bacterium]
DAQGKPTQPHARRRPRPAQALRRGAWRGGLPGGAGGSAPLAEPGAELRGHAGAAAAAPRAARRRLHPAAPHGGRAPALGRRHGEVPLSPGRRRGDRDGGDPRRRPSHALHLVAGGVRPPVLVLLHRRDGLLAQPRGARDRRAGARDAPARRAGGRDEHRVHGDGRAAHELEGGGPDPHDPQRGRRARDRRAAHHDLHRGRAPRHRGAGRAARAVPARDLDPRPHRRAAPAAHADQHEVPAGGRDRRGPRLRPAGDVRVRDAGRRERPAGARPPARRAGPRLRGVREPHPAAPGRRAGLHPHPRHGDRALRARGAPRRDRGGDPQEPRHRHRRGVRAATGRAPRPAAATTRRGGRSRPDSARCRGGVRRAPRL